MLTTEELARAGKAAHFGLDPKTVGLPNTAEVRDMIERLKKQPAGMKGKEVQIPSDWPEGGDDAALYGGETAQALARRLKVGKFAEKGKGK